MQPVTSHPSTLIDVLKHRPVTQTPLWLMRQAGRYLPEYRALREKSGGFMEMCLTPEVAAEITLQPVRRFPLDAAILFSDILMVPHGLGQPVRFEEGRGPVLEAIKDIDDLTRLDASGFAERVAPVMTAIRLIRKQLSRQSALLGFAGAPWTVASYMIEGASSRDYEKAKSWAYGDRGGFARLIDILVNTTSDYLLAQIDAGVDAVQIFDSWAGALAAAELQRWGLEPTAEIVRRLKQRYPDVPVIVFPRGAGVSYADYARRCDCDALSLDQSLPPAWAARELQPGKILQGNLDPLLVVQGGDAMRAAAENILKTFGAGRFVFNLGHGILQTTPPEHVAQLCEIVHGWRGTA
jgi:uroporphyrinogen decarboxylase